MDGYIKELENKKLWGVKCTKCRAIYLQQDDRDNMVGRTARIGETQFQIVKSTLLMG